MTKRNC